MGKLKRMDQVKTIISTYLSTQSIKATARRLQISKNTIRTYLKRIKSSGYKVDAVLDLSEEELKEVFYKQQEDITDREAYFESKAGEWISELRKVGVTRHLLWEEYRQSVPDGYGYSQFCDRLKRAIGRRDLTLSMDHPPGQVMQIDFAGKKMHWVDAYTGEVHACEILICTLPHSQFTFAIALTSQKVGDFIHGLNQALLYIGKLPKVLLCDNLKSYVTRSDRYEPKFNVLCEQLAAHYQVDLTATRPGKPKDKASVENLVKTVYQKIYAPLRNEVFHSEQELNEAIQGQLTIINHKPYQKREGSRMEVFEKMEKPHMQDLPSTLFEIKRITKAKVQRNYHVFLGEEKNYYSVPYRYANRDSLVLYTSQVVEIYINHQRVAMHQRLPSFNTYRHQTKDSHMPQNHQEWKKAQGYDAAYFLKEAEKIGKGTRWVISQVLISRIQHVQSFNSFKGILHLGRKYTPDRLEAAALRCQKAGKGTYSMLKRILSHQLDQQDEPEDQLSIPLHENIRGPEAYQ